MGKTTANAKTCFYLTDFLQKSNPFFLRLNLNYFYHTSYDMKREKKIKVRFSFFLAIYDSNNSISKLQTFKMSFPFIVAMNHGLYSLTYSLGRCPSYRRHRRRRRRTRNRRRRWRPNRDSVASRRLIDDDVDDDHIGYGYLQRSSAFRVGHYVVVVVVVAVVVVNRESDSLR